MGQPWPRYSLLKGSFVTDEHVLDPLCGRKQKESLRTLAWNIKMLPRGFHLLKAKRVLSFDPCLVTDAVVHCHWVLLFCGGDTCKPSLTVSFISRFLCFGKQSGFQKWVNYSEPA